jgi:hypothetical protein
MTIAFSLEPSTDAAPPVAFRWDVETDILSVRVDDRDLAPGPGRSVELAGTDGSWLILDVEGERLAGLEVAIWPELSRRSRLVPPGEVVDGRLAMRGAGERGGKGAIEPDVALTAESDDAEAVIYFRVGARRTASTVRVGRDLLVDLDRQQRMAGLWLLNVPPFPST